MFIELGNSMGFIKLKVIIKQKIIISVMAVIRLHCFMINKSGWLGSFCAYRGDIPVLSKAHLLLMCQRLCTLYVFVDVCMWQNSKIE